MKPTLNQDVGDRPERDVLRRLPIGLALAGGSVPVGQLVGILIVACRGVHEWKLSFGAPSRTGFAKPKLKRFRPTSLFERDSIRPAGSPSGSRGRGNSVRLRSSSCSETAFALLACRAEAMDSNRRPSRANENIGIQSIESIEFLETLVEFLAVC